jgi:hypothetical protein
VALKATPAFAGLSYQIWEALRDEAVAAMGAAGAERGRATTRSGARGAEYGS